MWPYPGRPGPHPHEKCDLPVSSAVSFIDLGVPAPFARVLADRGITSPTPIQAATLADSIGGRDVLGRGRTGSGKTYAFLLPLVTRLSASPAPQRARCPRALILAPTRELVVQIHMALAPLARAGLEPHAWAARFLQRTGAGRLE